MRGHHGGAIGTAGADAPCSATVVPRPGALERWRAEVEAGTRKNDMAHFDDLAAAAANEAAGLECLQRGDHHGARHFFDCARLRLLGCYLHPASDKGKLLLKEGSAWQRSETKRRKQGWLERNAATAAEYAL